MKKLLQMGLLICGLSIAMNAAAKEDILNVYAWSGEVPDFIIQKFEKETGIKVNFSTYDSNEIMYAKLNASADVGYDLVEPSSYFVQRMSRQGMLEKINKDKLSNFKNLNPDFLNQPYDPHNNYSIPLIWGVTGIFVNKNYYDPSGIQKWSDFWDKRFANQLLLLDDSREVFSIAFKSLGYSANDNNPEHIKQAYMKLRQLLPNTKIFKSDGVITIFIDEDATVGMAWNGDLYKAKKENANLRFIYPQDGFVIWVDNFAIAKNAPHVENAYKFLNFLMRPDVARDISIDTNFPTLNLAGKKLLPENLQDDPIIYPTHEVLKRGEFQEDVDDDALELYEKYWEKLKMEG